MKPFPFTIRGHGTTYEVAAYEPFPDAPFVVHRQARGGLEWVVTHRGTTHIAAYPVVNRLKDGLALAGRFAELVPLAGEVTDTSGPYETLRDQLEQARKTLGVA